MCVGAPAPEQIVMGSTSSQPRDTSNELIKSKYELSDENKKKNAEISAAKNKSKSLISFSDSDDNNTGTGVNITGGTMTASTPYGNRTGLDNLA